MQLPASYSYTTETVDHQSATSYTDSYLTACYMQIIFQSSDYFSSKVWIHFQGQAETQHIKLLGSPIYL